MKNIHEVLYHPSYEIMQPLGVVGSWDLSKQQHIETISHIIPVEQQTEIHVLYGGTATARNPIDAKQALTEAGYMPKIVVVDIAARPLKRVEKKACGVETLQADASHLPFGDGFFHVITTDFLLNMMPPPVGANILQEMARVLSPKGVMTMTVFTEEACRSNIQARLIRLFGNKYFASKDYWEMVLKENHLIARFRDFTPQRKPLLYHTDQFTQLIAMHRSAFES